MSQSSQDIAAPSDTPRAGMPEIRLTSRHLLGLIAALGLVAGLIANKFLTHEFNWRIDTAVYQAGGAAFLEGGALYSEPFDMGDISLPFIYPPIAAALFAPLSEFSTENAGNFIVALSSLLLLLCLYLIVNAVLGDRDRLLNLTLAAIAWPVALFTEPVWLNADLGQINIIIMALVVYDLFPVKRHLPRGTLIGVAAAIKLTPLAMLLYFLVRKDFRGIFNAVASLLVLTGVGALLSWERTKEFFSVTLLDLNAEGDSGVSTVFQSNSSLQAMIYRWWLSPEDAAASALPGILWLISAFLAIIIVGVLMHQLFHRGLHVEAMLANAMLMLLISPISWSHHWVWLPLWALVFLLRYLQHPARPKVLVWSAGVLTTFLLILPPKWWFGRDGVNVFELNLIEKILISDWTWLSIALLIATAYSLRAYRRSEHSDTAPSPA